MNGGIAPVTHKYNHGVVLNYGHGQFSVFKFGDKANKHDTIKISLITK
jgi:hypothetical protein